MRKVLLPLVVVAGLLLGALPAQAATLSWKDAEKDAVTQSGLPNEPTLDLLTSTITTTATKLQWKATLANVAETNPPQSLGYFFVFSFMYNDVTYDIRVREDVAMKTVAVRKVETGAQDVQCKDCKYVIDRKAKAVSIDVPLESIAAAVKQIDAKAPPFKSGVKVSGLLVNSYRSLVGVFLRADTAPAPDGTEFTI